MQIKGKRKFITTLYCDRGKKQNLHPNWNLTPKRLHSSPWEARWQTFRDQMHVSTSNFHYKRYDFVTSYYIYIIQTFFWGCPVKIALWLVWVINPHSSISFCVKITLLQFTGQCKTLLVSSRYNGMLVSVRTKCSVEYYASA